MNILTFDIEEWFHILDHDSTETERQWDGFPARIHRNVDRILDLLDRSQTSATFFCLGWIARQYPEVVRKIDERGYQIGTHSDMHKLAYRQTCDEFSQDLRKSIRSIEDVTGKKVIAYRAPGFSITKETCWVFDVLARNGIECDCSVFPTRRFHGGYAGFSQTAPCRITTNGVAIKEFPVNTAQLLFARIVFSGGGYFRMMPESVLRALWRKPEYVMAYFHPRDFDPEQPIIPNLSLFRRFRSYYGLSDCYEKLERLLNEHSFIDLQQAVETVDWEQTPLIDFSGATCNAHAFS